jgi:hypothetical protein
MEFKLKFEEINLESDESLEQMKQICESLKVDEQMRQNLNDSFYEKLWSRVESKPLRADSELDCWIIRALRNSSGKVSSSVCDREACLFRYLLEFVTRVQENEENLGEHETNSINFTLQYFINSIQGIFSINNLNIFHSFSHYRQSSCVRFIRRKML